jgi:hypothetical protein
VDGIKLAEYLLKNIRERKQDYRFIVGQIRGMTYAEEEIKAAMKGIELEDG